MLINRLLILYTIIFISSCKKEEVKNNYPINYRLSGIYVRDSSLTNDGIKALDLRQNGNYCWTRQIAGKDSVFCYGKFIQTSDTSLIWEDNVLVNFTIQTIDSIPKVILLQLNASPAVPALYGFYQ